jgi:hypothetical protein
MGGAFQSVAGVAGTLHIARWNGSTWSGLAGGTDGFPERIVVSGMDIYASGSFAHAGGVSVDQVAKWNGTSWSALVPGRLNNNPLTIAVSGSDVYIGGHFTRYENESTNYVAK